MVSADSVGVSRDPTYSGYFQLICLFTYGTLTPCGQPFHAVLLRRLIPYEVLQPQEEYPPGLGYFPFARRYWGNRFFFLFLQVLRCFSSLRCLCKPMYSVCSHSGIPGSKLVYQLPEAYRRLPRPSSPANAKTSPVCP